MNRIIVTKMTPEETQLVADFVFWMKAYKKSLLDSIISPDMDDEIVLISCEDSLESLYYSMNQDTKNMVNEIIESIFSDIILDRLEMFIYHLQKISQLTEAA